ncbi:MAG: MerR family transcriptional regulator [Firmicutes bacterium]|nr:MerR family transcriptional regulator [Bacillota bacterium]
MSRSPGSSDRLHGPDEPVYTISVAARLLGVSPQMLRQLEKEGILEPARTDANARLYSENELMLLRHVFSLMRDRGINLAGVKLILEMEEQQRARESREKVGAGAPEG